MSAKDPLNNFIIAFLKEKGRATIAEIHEHFFLKSIVDAALRSILTFSGRHSNEIDDVLARLIDQGVILFDGISCHVDIDAASTEDIMEPGIAMMANGMKSFIENACVSPRAGEPMKFKIGFIVDDDSIEMNIDDPGDCDVKGDVHSWRVPIGQPFSSQ